MNAGYRVWLTNSPCLTLTLELIRVLVELIKLYSSPF